MAWAISLCLKPFWRFRRTGTRPRQSAGAAYSTEDYRSEAVVLSLPMNTNVSSSATKKIGAPAGGDRHRICDCLLTAFRFGARLQSLYDWEMNLCIIKVFAFVSISIASKLLFKSGENCVSCDGGTATHGRTSWRLERCYSVEAAQRRYAAGEPNIK